MRCIETRMCGRKPTLPALVTVIAASLGLASCSMRSPGSESTSTPSAGPGAAAPAAQPAAPAKAAARPSIPPPAPARNWDDYRLQAALRIVAANPNATYSGPVPEPLLAIPVLEIELHADGSVKRVDVLRWPSQATDTTQLAIDAVRRAAPFGDVSRLPRPWKFAEVFLFDDERRFKPRTLDR